ncbi:hypothetical protein FHR32_003761 [Streptosporangium album]|uniref:Uncharacterized protein n=1 Tax=Streptosporangium album TaxID=47479 RepID=A0A7W7RWE2_9ACTN|nr:hypothetical protein [Streptosporangium album]
MPTDSPDWRVKEKWGHGYIQVDGCNERDPSEFAVFAAVLITLVIGGMLLAVRRLRRPRPHSGVRA